jgi:prepilin-type N-terminal cleavage/methylation domain-containing protein
MRGPIPFFSPAAPAAAVSTSIRRPLERNEACSAAPAVASVRKTRRPSAGFTLIELMIVVAIIAITAALAGPAIARAMHISRTDRANHDLIRLIRFARSQSIAFGRTYLVHFANTGDGRFELWEGTTSACRHENWTTIMAAGGCSSAGGIVVPGNCIDDVDSATYTINTQRVVYSSPASIDICFQPSGDAFVRPSAGGAWTTPPTGVVTFLTTRYEGAVAPDPQRGVIIPLGGAPRALR